MKVKNIFNKMNRFGNAGCPFLFALNYELDDGFIIK